MRKVAWLHTHMKFWGGGNRQVIEVAKRLSKKYDLTMFMGPTTGMTGKRLSDARVTHRVLPYLSSGSPAYWALLPLANALAAKRLSSSLSAYDVVITSYPSANMIGNTVHDTVLYYCFEPFSLFFNRTALNSLAIGPRLFWESVGLAYRRFDIKGGRKSRTVLTIDKYTANFIRKVYGRDSIITRTGVDTGFFRPVEKNGSVHDSYAGKRVLLSQTHGYSNFDGCEYLLFSMAMLKAEFPTIHLIFMSMFESPRRLSFLKSLSQSLGISANVEFLGFVDEALLPYYYSVAEVTVQPAIDTNTLLTTKEAMACERPVILFDGGPAEDIEGGDCGIVVPKRSTEGLANAIGTVLRDRDLAVRMGKNGRRRAVELFSWDAVTENVDNAIRIAFDRSGQAKTN